MSMLTLAISCLTTSNLPWFMDLTFQVPMQYCFYSIRLYIHHLHIRTGCCFWFGSISSFFLELFLHSFLVAYWAPSDLGISSFLCHVLWGVSYLFIFSCLWGSQEKNTEVVCHSLLQWTTFCQNSPPWPVSLGCPYRWWLIVSLSQTRLWSMWSLWLVLCDCVFHSVCPLMEKDKRFVEASWWEGLANRESESCSDGQGHAY